MTKDSGKLEAVSFNEKTRRVEVLSKALAGSADEKSFLAITTFLYAIPHEDLFKAWEAIQELKGIIPSHRIEILGDLKANLRRW